MSAEDLSTQAGLALQQDLALAGMIGCAHIERNGHQYGDGLANAPAELRDALMGAHDDLYSASCDRLAFKICNGVISSRSILETGYGTSLPSAMFADKLSKTQNFSVFSRA